MVGEKHTYGLLERLRSGDRAAAVELYSLHGARLRRALTMRLPREMRPLAEREERVHDTFERALRGLGRFEWRGQGAFLARLVDAAVQSFVAEAARSHASRTRDGEGSLATATPDPESLDGNVTRSDRGELLERALDLLSEEDRLILVHHEILGQDLVSLAHDLGTTEDSLRVRSREAMRELVRWFEEHATLS